MNGLLIDNFAGGGGASLGIEMALGRAVDIAVNHDPEAIAMHEANHPGTRHLREDVFRVSPRAVCAGRPVDLAWFSPDCKHFSKAKGGKPVSKKIRGLAWVAVRWAVEVRPRVICLENVEEFVTWGPLGPDGKPDPARKGETFRQFVRRLEKLGYAVEWRELVAADYGAPTTRKRLFLVARCDGQPIVWPEPTHRDPRHAADVFSAGLPDWRSAAECIDWSLPCPSIFLSKAEAKRLGVVRPLADATLARIANGLRRYVIEAKQPFIVEYHSAKRHGDHRVRGLEVPLPTQTTENRFALAVPHVSKLYGTSTGSRPDVPAPTVTSQGGHLALVAAFIAKHYTGVIGQRMQEALGTVTAVDHHSLLAPVLVGIDNKSSGPSAAWDATQPLRTITLENRFAQVSAFLVKYYGNERGGVDLTEPMDTVVSKDRMGLVVVEGEAYQIVDIGLRMLQPRELARAQGFPDSYILTGTKTSQVARIGNSVCPPVAAAIVRANCQFAARKEEVA